MQSDIEMAVQWSKKLETLLEDRFGATGKGLHEKVKSVQKRLPVTASRKLHFVATIRNKIVHETTYSKIEDRGRFERTCSDIVSELEVAKDSRANRRGAFPKIRSEAGLNSWFPPSPFWLLIVGGVVGFAIPTICGGSLMTALVTGTAGAAAGLFWRAVLTALLLACAIVAVFWLLAFAYHSVR